jgi:DNA processing protein
MGNDWYDKYFWLWLFYQEGFGSTYIIYIRKWFLKKYRRYKDLRKKILDDRGFVIKDKLAVKKEVQELFGICKDYAITIVPFWSGQYSRRLIQIYDPPAFLFCRGNLDLLQNEMVSVVGTRSLTNYGRKVIDQIVDPLSEVDVTVVSGLAQGIDGLVHKRLLETKGGYALAVLPGGPMRGYPVANKDLYKAILRNGLVLSEYYPGVNINKGMFASRNRIIAGLSNIVVVIEAPEKSGALITADLALQYNRDVAAVPGNIFNRASQGTNSLIKQGAILVQDGYEVLRIFFQDSYVYEQQIEAGYMDKNGDERVSDIAKKGLTKEQIKEHNLYRAIKQSPRVKILITELKEHFNIKKDQINDLIIVLYQEGISCEDLVERLGGAVGLVRSFLTRMNIKGILKLELDGLIKLDNKCCEISNC